MLLGCRPRACSGSPLLSECCSQSLRLSWDSKEWRRTFQLFKIWKIDFPCNRCRIVSCAVPRIRLYVHYVMWIYFKNIPNISTHTKSLIWKQIQRKSHQLLSFMPWYSCSNAMKINARLLVLKQWMSKCNQWHFCWFFNNF